MRRVFRSRVFILVALTLALLVLTVLSIEPGSPLNLMSSPISVVLRPVERFYLELTGKASGWLAAVRNSAAIREENTMLRLEIARLQSEADTLRDNGRRYDELKRAFELQDAFANYRILGANRLSGEIGAWFDLFRIDVGTASGIRIDSRKSCPVLNAGNELVGRVHAPDLISSKVMPLTHEGFAVAARVNSVGGATCRVRGDLILREQNLCRVDQIMPERASLHVGDELVTSGQGGLFPGGIRIGTIIEVSDHADDCLRTAILRPFADLSQLDTVFLLLEPEP